MSERSGILRKLVIDGHVNVAERQILGQVYRREVAQIVKEFLETNERFSNHEVGGAVYEGATLIKAPSGARITWQRAYAWDPFTVAESRTEEHPDLDIAIERFITTEWAEGIDGVSVK